MSTKVSIKHRMQTEDQPGFHLYEDVLDFEDEPPIYLQLEGVAVELQTEPGKGACVTFRLPRELARELGLLPASEGSAVSSSPQS